MTGGPNGQGGSRGSSRERGGRLWNVLLEDFRHFARPLPPVDWGRICPQRKQSVKVVCIDFSQAETEIRAVRNAVFGVEQKVAPEVNWDGRDPECSHVLGRLESGEAVGTGRLAPDGKIGRLAVIKSCRGQGFGALLVETLVGVALQQGISEVYLHGQTQALSFYEQLGFRASGELFLEAGIEHRYMWRRLV